MAKKREYPLQKKVGFPLVHETAEQNIDFGKTLYLLSLLV